MSGKLMHCVPLTADSEVMVANSRVLGVKLGLGAVIIAKAGGGGPKIRIRR